MGRLNDLAGATFDRWTVVRKSSPYGAKITRFLCRCVCGTEKEVCSYHLQNGFSRSCGCIRVETKARLRHGHSPKNGAWSSEYHSWSSMIARCTNPRHPGYRHYGGRGISVCDRWRNDFAAFLADMGIKPEKGLSIDRINNDGNYEHGNCRWATWSEQGKNKRPRSKKAA